MGFRPLGGVVMRIPLIFFMFLLLLNKVTWIFGIILFLYIMKTYGQNNLDEVE